jgi:hypothetical protein
MLVQIWDQSVCLYSSHYRYTGRSGEVWSTQAGSIFDTYLIGASESRQ